MKVQSPKSKVQSQRGLVLVLLGLWTLGLGPWTVLADLTITATPGFVFSDSSSGRPTVANLNRALNFTYLISGTIGGTNAGLAAGSVNVSHLASSVGGSNIMVTSSGLVVSNNAIGVNQLNSTIAGAGLGGGGGTALVINCDSNTIVNTGDIIGVGTGLSNVNVSANAAIAASKLGFTTNTVLGSTAYGTNGNLSLSNLTVSGTTLMAVTYHASVIFDPTASGATVLASNNVSSVTRSSTGIYVVNFTPAKANTNYLVFIGSGEGSANGIILNYSTKTTTNVTILCNGNSGTATDGPEDVSVMIW